MLSWLMHKHWFHIKPITLTRKQDRKWDELHFPLMGMLHVSKG
jgi:hypothetical protein